MFVKRRMKPNNNKPVRSIQEIMEQQAASKNAVDNWGKTPEKGPIGSRIALVAARAPMTPPKSLYELPTMTPGGTAINKGKIVSPDVPLSGERLAGMKRSEPEGGRIPPPNFNGSGGRRRKRTKRHRRHRRTRKN
jgi:hypothetical protein